MLEALPTNEHAVLDLMLGSELDTPLLFIKNMAHHIVGMDREFIKDMTGFILTRDPIDMIPSLSRGLGRVPSLVYTGYWDQVEILDETLASGAMPIVVDSGAVLNDPGVTLSALCDALGVPFDPAMLSWPAGSKSIDGVWGPHWYTRLHATTGFEPPLSTCEPLPPELADTYALCEPLYERLKEYAI